MRSVLPGKGHQHEPIFRATLLGKDGNLIASTEKDSFTRSTSGNFKLEDSLPIRIWDGRNDLEG